MKQLASVSLLFSLFLFISESSPALPRFASRLGARCQSCHVNPSGGGMRQAFGVRYGREELPVPTWSQDLGLDDFTTQLSDFVSVGADFRTLFFYQQDTTGSQNAFFQMQGDVYLNFKISKKVYMYIDKGLYSGFEIFGLLNILPEHGSIKVGKFIPNYGLKIDDHRTFIRTATGLSPETGTPFYTGGEVSVAPGPFTITAGGYNASDAGNRPPGSSKKALLGRVEGMFDVSKDVFVSLGANVLDKEVGDVQTTLLGGLGSFSYGNLTLTGEVDLMKTKMSGQTTDGLIIYGEADYAVIQGVDLKFIYDFYDPDKDLKTGSFTRYGFGLEFFPLSGVEVRPIYRISREEPTDSANDEFQCIVHFYL